MIFVTFFALYRLTHENEPTGMTREEYNQAVEDYADRLFRFVVKSIEKEDEAQDVVQDSFEKLWMRVSEVRYKKVKSYLFTTAYHTMIDRIRKNSRQTAMEDAGSPEPAHDDQYSDLQEVLHRAIQRLPDVQRSVLLMRDYEGYSYKEIAEIAGLNESQVKVYIYRARVFLKEYIGALERVI